MGRNRGLLDASWQGIRGDLHHSVAIGHPHIPYMAVLPEPVPVPARDGLSGLDVGVLNQV